MDRFENGLSKEDSFDSWDIISDDYEDTQDFEIIRNSRDSDVSPESCDTIVVNNTNSKRNKNNNNNNTNNNNNNNNAFRKDIFTTDDSGETTDEAYEYEDTKKSKQVIKREHNNFVVAHANKLTTKKELKLKRKQTLPEKRISKKNDETKNKFKKCNNKKSRPFLNSANLGALLTAFGLSLIFLNSSDKTCITEQESKNISETLVDAISDRKVWNDDPANMFDEEKLLERFLPTKANRTILEKKNLKTKILKRIDRKMKQQTRGYDLKPLKKERKTTSSKTLKTSKISKNGLIGPLTKGAQFYANNLSAAYTKPASYRDVLFADKTAEKEYCIAPANTPDSNVSKTKAEIIDKFLDVDVEKLTVTPRDLELLKQNNTDDQYAENRYKVINYEVKKKTNCSSIYRDFIKAEMLFKKILNNSYDIPKPKTPTDLAYSIENKINVLTDDNINLGNIIEEQESLLRQIQNKIQYKKDILQKRSQQKIILQKRLKFANWMKQKRDHDDPKPPKVNLGERILKNLVIRNVQSFKPEEYQGNNTSSSESHPVESNASRSTTEIATRYELKYPFSEDKYKMKSEEETAFYMKRKLHLLKKHEELKRSMEIKKRKLMDEEHMKANKMLEKSDPKRAWTKKKTEF